jgi:hypothetical protein
MINHSLPIAVIFFASETPDHLACRHRRDRNWNVSQAFSRNFDMMSSRGKQSNQSLCDSPQTTTTLLSHVASWSDHRLELQERTKKGLEVEKNSHLRARRLTAEACYHLRLTNNKAGTQDDDLSAN